MQWHFIAILGQKSRRNCIILHCSLLYTFTLNHRILYGIIFLFITNDTFVASCGSCSQRIMRSVDGTIDDYNNGDSTSIIIPVILFVIIAVLWILKQKEK